MKKYVVNLTACIDTEVTVEASSEEEAKEKAIKAIGDDKYRVGDMWDFCGLADTFVLG